MRNLKNHIFIALIGVLGFTLLTFTSIIPCSSEVPNAGYWN